MGPMIVPGPNVPARHLAAEARTLPDLFRLRCETSAGAPAIYEKRDGTWTPMSWTGFFDEARRVARGLAELGVKRGDRVAVLGPTKSPWAIYDMAAQLLGAVSFGIYPKQTIEQIRYLLEHSEAKVILVDSQDELESVLAAAKGLSSLTAIVPWDAALAKENASRDPRIVSPEKLSGEKIGDAELADSLGAISPEDTAILVYTSGTTGLPKGAMISHRNILSCLTAFESVVPLTQSDLSLNFLPMAHAAERVLGFYGRISSGTATAYARSMGSVLDDVREVQPTLFGSVPRIFEKAYAKIHDELEHKPRAVQKLVAWASAVGREAAKLEIEGREIPRGLRMKRAIADRLLGRRVRAAFGGRIRFFATGAAPIALEILEFFWGVGLPIYELYGMTEATVVTHCNRPGATKLGTVGRITAPMEARVAEDGEILMRGPWVFQGYYKSPDATAEAVKDGWLHTGDIGTIDADGFLRITDRKKHLIITAGGKNLAPANIENAIKNQDPLVSQVYAHGDRRAFVTALIAPSPLETLAWGKERNLVQASEVDTLSRELLDSPANRSNALNEAMARVVSHPDFSARIREAVRKGNKQLAQVESVRRFTVLDRDFSQESGELTPTMKLKRKAVEQLHAKAIDAMYEGGGIES